MGASELQALVRRQVLEADEAISELHRTCDSRSLERARSKASELSTSASELATAYKSGSASPPPSSKHSAVLSRQVQQLTSEAERVQHDLRSAESEFSKKIDGSSRAQLLGTASHPSHRRRAADSNAPNIDVEAQALQSTQRSLASAEGLHDTGAQILRNLAQQREQMKSTQRKVLDLVNSATLSESVTRAIERRHSAERRIAYGGMVLVTLLILAILFWKSRR